MNKPTVTIGIPTYNRPNLLKMMAASLFESDFSNAIVHIKIFDDCSTEFNSDYLKKLFPTAEKITVNKKNLKADLNTLNIYKDFVTSDDDYLFIGDSDIIFNKEWLNFALSHINFTDGLLSLYNSVLHAQTGVHHEKPELITKNDIGSAGTFFTKDKVNFILNNLSEKECGEIDWNFSKLFINNKLKIYVSNNSYVQHIGIMGQNSVFWDFEYGSNFIVDSKLNGQILNDVIIDFRSKLKKAHIDGMKRSKIYLTGYIILTPFRLLKSLIKLITKSIR